MDKVSETFSDRKIYQTRTFDCQSIVFESSCLIDFTIRERFRNFIMNPGRASSIFKIYGYWTTNLYEPDLYIYRIKVSKVSNMFNINTIEGRNTGHCVTLQAELNLCMIYSLCQKYSPGIWCIFYI